MNPVCRRPSSASCGKRSSRSFWIARWVTTSSTQSLTTFWNAAERRLGHGEDGALRSESEVAREGELEAGADGVALHSRDRDEVGSPEPGEPALEDLDPLFGVTRLRQLTQHHELRAVKTGA